MPTWVRAFFIAPINTSLLNGWPSSNMNRGPGDGRRLAIKDNTDATGQRKESVRPMTMVTPFPKWSVLLWRKCNDRIRGLECESTEISWMETTTDQLGELDEQVNSPQRRNPKYAKQQAAQSIDSRYLTGGTDHTRYSAAIMSGVFGRRLGWVYSGCCRRIPFRT